MTGDQTILLLPFQIRPSKLNTLKLLTQSHRHISRLSQRILLPQTDPRTTREGEVMPSEAHRLLADPPLRLELFGILAPYIPLSMVSLEVPGDLHVFGNEERR